MHSSKKILLPNSALNNEGFNQSAKSHLRRKSVQHLRNLDPHLFSRALRSDQHNTILNQSAEGFRSPDNHSHSFTMESLSTVASTKNSRTPSRSRNERTSSFFRQPLRPILEKNKTKPNSITSSQTIKEKVETNSKLRKQSQEAGKEALVSTQKCKELENQVQILQNRIKKLKEEEEFVSHKIKETTVKTQKVLETKKRHKEDLMNKITRELKNSLELTRLKKEILKERENQKLAICQTFEENLRAKQENANSIKLDNKLLKMIKEENNRAQMEKNKQLINKVKASENIFMRTQLVKQAKPSVNNSLAEKIQSKKQAAEALEKRLKELSQVEEQLVSRLNNTYSLHRAKFEELEKAYSINVTLLNEQPKPNQNKPADAGESYSKIQEEECSFDTDKESKNLQEEKSDKCEVIRS